MNKKFDKVREYTHILLCSPNLNSLSLIRSFGQEGISPIIVALRVKGKLRSCLLLSKYAKNIHYVSSYDEGIDYIIQKYGEGDKKKFLHLHNDSMLSRCDNRYNELKDSFFLFNGRGQGKLTPYFDKKDLCELADACGLPIPQHEIVKRGQLPQKLGYPIFIKSRTPFGFWKADATICKTQEDLIAAYDTLRENEWLMEEYIDKVCEVSVQGISLHAGEEIYLPYKKVYTRLREKDFGSYMYYERNDLPDSVQQGIQRAIKTIGFSGCFEVEFLQDKEGKLYFLEINLRYSTSNQGMRQGGINLPMEWALSEINGKLSTQDISLRNDRYYAMNEMVDIDYFLMQHRISWRTWLEDARRAECFYIFDKHDIVPALAYFTIYAAKKALALLTTKKHHG